MGTDITFSEDVLILNYTLGYITPELPAISASPENVVFDFVYKASSLTETNLVAEAVTNFANQFDVIAGQALQILASNFAGT